MIHGQNGSVPVNKFEFPSSRGQIYRTFKNGFDFELPAEAEKLTLLIGFNLLVLSFYLRPFRPKQLINRSNLTACPTLDLDLLRV